MARPYPIIRLSPGKDRRVASGHPWAYSNEIAMNPETKALSPGTIAILENSERKRLGLGFFNPKSLIAFRFLTRDSQRFIDDDFIFRRLSRALALRDGLFDRPFYRLVHAEADGLPGCVIDRYGDAIVIEPSSAGAHEIRHSIAAAIDRLIQPRSILIEADSKARSLEGLGPIAEIYKGKQEQSIEIIENDVRFLIDREGGQKTGWFFDQRENRQRISKLAKGKDILDLYSYLGGFAIEALASGAKSALAIDRSAAALELAKRSATLNSIEGQFETSTGDAFETLERFQGEHRTFDIVVADPPAFVKAKKDLPQGAKAYRKLARLCAGRVRSGGFLFIASCSHNMPLDQFQQEIGRGLHDAGRSGRILAVTGAGPDHPLHPLLPESAYLKALTLAID